MTLGITGLMIITGIIIYLVIIYNHLVASRNQYFDTFSQLQDLLTSRYALIEQLIQAVNKELIKEKRTLQAALNSAKEACLNASENAGNPSNMSELAAAEELLKISMDKLLTNRQIIHSAQSNHIFSNLLDSLTALELDFTMTSKTFNQNISYFNLLRNRFPNYLIARFYGIAPAELLTIKK